MRTQLRTPVESRKARAAKLTVPWFRVPFHETAGAGIALHSTSNALASLTAAGTLTNIHANAGVITPAGDNYIPVSTAVIGNVLRCDTGYRGITLIQGLLYYTTNPSSADEVLLSTGPVDGVNGGYVLVLNTSGALKLVWRGIGDGANTSRSCPNAFPKNVLTAFAVEIDPVAATVTWHYDAEAKLTQTLTANPVNLALGSNTALIARTNSTANAIQTTYGNALGGSGSAARLAALTGIKLPSTATSVDAARLVAAYRRLGGRLPVQALKAYGA